NGAAASAQAGATDDDRGDHVQLQACTAAGIAAAEMSEAQYAGPAGKEPRQQVEKNLAPPDGNAAQAGRRLVGADRVTIAAEHGEAQEGSRQNGQQHEAPEPRI